MPNFLNIRNFFFRRRETRPVSIIPLSNMDYREAIGDVLYSDITTACNNWIMRTFPEAPLSIKHIDNDELVYEHDLIKLVGNPNPFQKGDTFWQSTVSSYAMSGNAYWIKLGKRGSVIPEELWYINHEQITPTGDENDFIKYYEYNTGSKKLKLKPEWVVHFKFGQDPENARYGLSPVKALYREVYSDLQASNHTASLLRNRGRPGLVISPEGDEGIEPENLQEIKRDIRANFTGDAAGDTLVMSRKTNVEQFGFSPEDMNLRDLRRIPEERVSANLGIPAMVVGLGAGLDRSTFANMKEAREMAYELCIIPMQRSLSRTIKTSLLGQFETDPDAYDVFFDISKVRILQDDEDSRSRRQLTLYAGGLTKRSEARRVLELPVSPEDEAYKDEIKMEQQLELQERNPNPDISNQNNNKNPDNAGAQQNGVDDRNRTERVVPENQRKKPASTNANA